MLNARYVVIAAGSRAKGLSMLQPDGDRIWSSDQAVYPPTIPASLVIIGPERLGWSSRMSTLPSAHESR